MHSMLRGRLVNIIFAQVNVYQLIIRQQMWSHCVPQFRAFERRISCLADCLRFELKSQSLEEFG